MTTAADSTAFVPLVSELVVGILCGATKGGMPQQKRKCGKSSAWRKTLQMEEGQGQRTEVTLKVPLS